MNAIETLISVLCGPGGKCCISGSDDDRRLIDSALAELAQAAQPAPAGESLRTDALCDLSYSHGLKAGWNYCASDDLAGFERAQKIGTEALRTLKSTTAQPTPQQEAQHLAQALTDRENQPNQYGVEFGMSGTHMHFKVGNQLFRLAYEPDEQEEFDFMKRMLVNAFSIFTHDVKTAPQPYPMAQAADSVLEDAARYRHLRDCNSGSLVVVQITGTGEDDWYVLTEDDADAAIDTARKQGEKQ